MWRRPFFHISSILSSESVTLCHTSGTCPFSSSPFFSFVLFFFSPVWIFLRSVIYNDSASLPFTWSRESLTQKAGEVKTRSRRPVTRTTGSAHNNNPAVHVNITGKKLFFIPVQFHQPDHRGYSLTNLTGLYRNLRISTMLGVWSGNKYFSKRLKLNLQRHICCIFSYLFILFFFFKQYQSMKFSDTQKNWGVFCSLCSGCSLFCGLMWPSDCSFHKQWSLIRFWIIERKRIHMLSII